MADDRQTAITKGDGVGASLENAPVSCIMSGCHTNAPAFFLHLTGVRLVGPGQAMQSHSSAGTEIGYRHYEPEDELPCPSSIASPTTSATPRPGGTTSMLIPRPLSRSTARRNSSPIGFPSSASGSIAAPP